MSFYTDVARVCSHGMRHNEITITNNKYKTSHYSIHKIVSKVSHIEFESFPVTINLIVVKI